MGLQIIKLSSDDRFTSWMTGIMIVLRTSHLTLPTHSTCWQIAVAAVKFFLTGDEKEDSEDESSSDSEVSD